MQHRILLVTELSKPWNDGFYYKVGFEKNGHMVVPFDPADFQNPRDRIFTIIKEKKINFLLHTKDEFPAEVFQELRKFTKVIQWYPDPVIPDWLPPYVRSSDIFFTMAEGLVDILKTFNPNVFWLTQAFEPSLFEMNAITSEDRKAYASDVTFVGNLGSKPQYLPRRIYLKRAIETGFHLKWWGPKLPRKITTVPLILGKLGRSYGGKFVWGEEHAKIAKLSKVYLGFDSQPHVRKSVSERLYIALGCGAFYLCLHVEGLEDLFELDKEIVSFHSEEEMIDKLKFYLHNEELRKKISEAGHIKVLKEHTYQVRIKQMMSILKQMNI